MKQRAHPVRLRGVVTYYERDWELLFVQDATAGIFVWPRGERFSIKAGDMVEVEGASGPGQYAPIVDRPRVRVLGSGTMPASRLVTLEHLVTGREDSQWVGMRGTIRSGPTPGNT